jgi:hypothetical protein
MTNFATLKKTAGSLDRLTKEINKINSPAERQEDTRFWKLERDKSGNGSAIIRFLPTPATDGDDSLPWVRYFDHGFQGPSNKWYIENSLTSIDQKDPVSEYNSRLWAQSSDDNSSQRKQVRNQKRRLHYVGNILVESDPKNPENEGTIRLFKFGKKIFDKITLLMNPEFEGDKPVNPFDLWSGAPLKLRIRTVDGYPNYDQSVWGNAGPLSDDDKKLEEIWKAEHSLKEFIDPKNYKSYDVLKAKLLDVLEIDEETFTTGVKSARASIPAKRASAPIVEEDDETPPFTVDDEDDDLKQFKELARG